MFSGFQPRLALVNELLPSAMAASAWAHDQEVPGAVELARAGRRDLGGGAFA